jgi:hypothetical protein
MLATKRGRSIRDFDYKAIQIACPACSGANGRAVAVGYSTRWDDMTIIAAASATENTMHVAMTDNRMNRRMNRRRALQLTVVGVLAGASLPARAHHGWSWAEDAQTELKGTVRSVSMAPPHPSLQVAAADGVLWQIDLANPNQTDRAGFTATSAKPGDAIVVLGNRHMDKTKMLMKAVRITVAGKTYDLYPERIRTN